MTKGTADLNRRSVLQGMGGLGAAAIVGSFLARPGAARAAESLNYMCWEGYNAPGILDPFQKSKDVSISMT